MLYVGIDTGVHTGFAVWDARGRKLTEVSCLPIHRALQRVRDLWEDERLGRVYFEDARQRKWYGNNTARKDRAKLQGAGSVKRDCTIWEDYLKDLGIPFVAVPPKNNCTKLDDTQFRRLTGWEGRTNEHGRDAAMLVFGRI